MKERITEYFEGLMEDKYYTFPKTEKNEHGHERQVQGEYEFKPALRPDGEHIRDYRTEPTYIGLALHLDMTMEEFYKSEDKDLIMARMKIQERLEERLRKELKVTELKEMLK